MILMKLIPILNLVLVTLELPNGNVNIHDITTGRLLVANYIK